MYFISPQVKAVKYRGKESALRVRETHVQILMPSFTVCIVLGKLLPSLNPSAQCPPYGVAIKSESGDLYKMPSPVQGIQPIRGFKKLTDSEAPAGRGGLVVSSLVSGEAETYSSPDFPWCSLKPSSGDRGSEKSLLDKFTGQGLIWGLRPPPENNCHSSKTFCGYFAKILTAAL